MIDIIPIELFDRIQKYREPKLMFAGTRRIDEVFYNINQESTTIAIITYYTWISETQKEYWSQHPLEGHYPPDYEICP